MDTADATIAKKKLPIEHREVQTILSTIQTWTTWVQISNRSVRIFACVGSTPSGSKENCRWPKTQDVVMDSAKQKTSMSSDCTHGLDVCNLDAWKPWKNLPSVMYFVWTIGDKTTSVGPCRGAPGDMSVCYRNGLGRWHVVSEWVEQIDNQLFELVRCAIE